MKNMSEEIKILPIIGNQSGAKKYWKELLKLGIRAEYHNPEYILVLSGDGGLLGGERDYYKMNVPIIGIGFGTLNFLLNRNFLIPEKFIIALRKNQWERLKMRGIRLYMTLENGADVNGIAFNEVTIKPMNRTASAYLSAELIDSGKLYETKGDGLIVATPQGSSAYSYEAGNIILPLTSTKWCLTSIAARRLAFQERVTRQEIIVLNKKNNDSLFVVADNKAFENVVALRVMPSKYEVELLFDPSEVIEERRFE